MIELLDTDSTQGGPTHLNKPDHLPGEDGFFRRYTLFPQKSNMNNYQQLPCFKGAIPSFWVSIC